MKQYTMRLLSVLLVSVLLLSLVTSCESGSIPAETSGTQKETEAPVPVTEPVSLYVSPDGNDANEGTKEAPLATLDGAKTRVRTVLSERENAEITVYFRAGTYLFSETSVFSAEDSGKKNIPVTYRAYDNETVVFSGAEKIDPARITPAENEIKARVLDAAAGEKLMKLDLSDRPDAVVPQYCFANESYQHYMDPMSIDAYGDVVEDRVGYLPAGIYMGDTAMTPARWPNDHYLTVRTPVTQEGKDREKTVSFGFVNPAKDRVLSWSREAVKNLYIYGNLQEDWTGENFEAHDLDFDELTLTLHGGGWYYTAYDTKPTGMYYFYNLPEEIDLPGESYTDYENKAVYFLPTDDFDPENVCVNVLAKPLLTLDGAENLVFEGIAFSHTRHTAVTGTGTSDITFRNCEISHTGNQMVSVSGTRVVFTGCECYDSAHGGMYLYGGDRVTLTSSGNVIENCRIHDCVAGCYHQYAVNAAALGLRISHNEIYNAAATGILINNNDILIEYNDIHDICKTLTDAGAIYYWSTGGYLGTTVRYNYFHDLGTSGGAAGTSYVYVDGVAPGADVYGNLFVGGNTSVKTNQVTGIHNNIMISPYTAMFNGDISLENPTADYKSFGLTRAEMRYSILYDKIHHDSGAHGADLLAVKADSEIWREHYKGTVWESYLALWSEENYTRYQEMTDEDYMKYIRENGLSSPLSVTFDANVTCDAADIFPGNGNRYTAAEYGYNTDGEFHEAENAEGMQIQCVLGNNVAAEKEWFADFDGGDYTLTKEGLAKIRETIPGFEEIPLDKIGIEK